MPPTEFVARGAQRTRNECVRNSAPGALRYGSVVDVIRPERPILSAQAVRRLTAWAATIQGKRYVPIVEGLLGGKESYSSSILLRSNLNMRHRLERKLPRRLQKTCQLPLPF